MSARQGFKGKVDIEGNAFSCNRISVRNAVQEVVMTNTEGEAGDPGFEGEEGGAARLADIAEGVITLTKATFSDTSDPFQAPIALRVGNYYTVNVYPAGRTGKKYSYHVMLRNTTHDFAVPGGQPFSCEFATDGMAASDLILAS